MRVESTRELRPEPLRLPRECLIEVGDCLPPAMGWIPFLDSPYRQAFLICNMLITMRGVM
jgi:hypothetical protein